MSQGIELDLTEIVAELESELVRLINRSILLTGATGMFGIWFLSLFKFLNENFEMNITVEVLSRNPKRFLEKNPEFNSCKWIVWNQSDVRNFVPILPSYHHVIHGATTSAAETFGGMPPMAKFDVVLQGTLRVLEATKEMHPEGFLYISSGSVYNSSYTQGIKETNTESPLASNTGASIAHGKRAAEFACFATLEDYPDISLNVARCFTFLGPHLPLDLHYAIGNFIKSILDGQPIHLRNTQQVHRSYLYMSDGIAWLLKILLSKQSKEIYNVGSPEGITLLDLANMLSNNFGARVIFGGSDENLRLRTSAPSFYIPDTAKIESQIGVRMKVSLLEGVRRTIDFESSRAH